MATIPVIVEEREEKRPSGILGALTPDEQDEKVRHIDTDKLRQSIADLSEKISGILQDVKQVGDFKLNQVQVSAEVNAEGGVSLIGIAKAGAKGAITLTFGL